MLFNKKKRLINLAQKGFTYVEGILAISLTLAASTAIAFSIQKAISTYNVGGPWKVPKRIFYNESLGVFGRVARRPKGIST